MSLLALHGFTGCGADFAPWAELCGGTWHCPDLPGHGTKPQLDCSPAAMLTFINAQRAAITAQGGTAKTLLGYSMGARAALLHALHFPETWEQLILISVNPGIEDPAARAMRCADDAELAAFLQQKGVAAFLDFWQQTPLIRSQQNIRSEWRETMQTNRQKHSVDGLANSLHLFGQGSFPNLWPQLPHLKCPVHLITGANDTKYTAISKRICSTLPVAHVTHNIIAGAAHMPHLEQAERTRGICAG